MTTGSRPLVVLHGYEDPPGRRRVVDPADPAWRLLEPRGPLELPGGPAWFASDDDGPVEAQLVASVQLVAAVLAAAGPPDLVTVGGFSQGGAVALALALSGPIGVEPPARVFCVNGWLPHATTLTYDPARLVAAGTGVLVVASTRDEVVLVQQGRSASRYLERAGVAVDYVELPGGHAVGPDALAAVAEWVAATP